MCWRQFLVSLSSKFLCPSKAYQGSFPCTRSKLQRVMVCSWTWMSYGCWLTWEHVN